MIVPFDVIVQMPIDFLDREISVPFFSPLTLHAVASNIDTGESFTFSDEDDTNFPLVDGIVMLPLRVLTNSMGVEIEWDEETAAILEHDRN